MKQFKYTALNINKEKFTGTFLAEDEKDLAVQLAKQNLFLVSSEVYTGKTPSAFFTMGTGKVNMTELTTFCRQFSIMLNTGIPILECLENLKVQPFSSFFKGILQIIYEDVKSGVVLSEALEKHAKVFPDFFRNMVYVGEVSGKLGNVFNSLADYYEKDAAVKRKVKSALSYPLMLAALTIGLVALMLAFVIPTFRDALTQLEVEMTGLTKAVYAVSDFLLAYWLYILAIIVVIVCGLVIFAKTQPGKYFFDKLKLHTPLVKKVQTDLIASRFARAFALMISSGMDVTEALDAVKIVIGNKDAERRFAVAAEEIKHGAKMAVAFEKQNLFPSMLLQMVAVGERTASLDEVLTRSCSYFDDQVESSLNKTTSTITPVMLLILGAFIAIMFLAVYSPMISIMENLV